MKGYYSTINGFYRFITERRVRNRFMINIHGQISTMHGNNTSISSFYDDFKKSNSTSFVTYAFIWRETKEGHDFWERLHEHIVGLT